jgi:FtsP/CotA-like multicopper oxidase with cupredoxin domain
MKAPSKTFIMQRRHFLNMVSAAMGTAFVAGCRKGLEAPGADATSALQMAARRGGTAPVRYPLKPYQPVSPQGLNLTAAPATLDIGGRSSNVWAYNGQFPGPVLEVQRGTDQASPEYNISLMNGLQQPTITHWHGMIVDHMNDGHPMNSISPGQTYNYSFAVNQRAALNWYHPHPHMMTGEQVYMGLAGAFIVRDEEEKGLGLPSGAYEVPLIIRDATLDSTGNLVYKPRSGGFLGQVPMVNGTLSPYLNVDRATYRFRILNGSNSRIFGLTLSSGTFTLIGNDGGLLASPVGIGRIDMANGERLDVLVDFSKLAPGATVMLQDARSGWSLLEFRVGNTQGPAYTPPATLSTITPLSNPVTTRTFSFDGMSKINGKVYDMMDPGFQVPFNKVERWRFTTSGNAPHPVHVHGASFQVVSRSGGRGEIFAWERGWKDTVLLEDNETVEVLIRFDGFPGMYLLHCHKLEHEDMGMMANFTVV